jgi:hypothetical protein
MKEPQDGTPEDASGDPQQPPPGTPPEPQQPVGGETAAFSETDPILRDESTYYYDGDALREQLSTLQAENYELQQQNFALEEKTTALQAQTSQLQAEKAQLLTSLTGVQQQNATLSTQAAQLSTELSGLKVADQRQRQQIADLTQQKEELHEQLREKIVRSSRMPDDFASAVGHSIDAIQTRLAGLSNPVTDFAVREFSIDARVAVNITPLGTVEYRFIQPGESIDPTAVSNLSMTVVPVPKQTQAGAWLPTEFTPSVGVEEVPGVGRSVQQHLNDQGVFTVGDLLHAGSRVRSSMDLAAMLDVDRGRLGEWLAHAELLTVRDIDGGISGVLYEIGVRGLEDLASTRPEELAARFNQQLVRTGRKRVQPVDAARVTPWIRAAQAYVGRHTSLNGNGSTSPGPVTSPPPPPVPAGST